MLRGTARRCYNAAEPAPLRGILKHTVRLVDVTALDITATRRLRSVAPRGIIFDVRDASTHKWAFYRASVRAETADPTSRVVEGIGHGPTPQTAALLATSHALSQLEGNRSMPPSLLVLDPQKAPVQDRRGQQPTTNGGWNVTVASEGVQLTKRTVQGNFERMASLKLPRSDSDHLFNSAAERVEPYMDTALMASSWSRALTAFSALAASDSFMRAFTLNDVVRFQIQHMNHQAVLLPVPGVPTATAIGVGTRKRYALACAAMLAVEMSKLMSINGSHHVVAAAHHPAPPTNPVQLSDMLERLQGFAAKSGQPFRLEQAAPEVSGSSVTFECEVAGMCLKMTGSTKLEAMSRTVRSAYEDLRSLDSSFQSYLDDHAMTPRAAEAPTTATPPSVPSVVPVLQLSLPDEIGARIRAEFDTLPPQEHRQTHLAEEESSAGDDSDLSPVEDVRAVLRHPRLVSRAEDPQQYRHAAQIMQQRRFKERDSHARYLNEIKPVRETLPMVAKQLELMATIENNPVTIICGTTGCGKTTQVPQYILDYEIDRLCGPDCAILVTQPRRISAITVAERIAAERLQCVGQDDVGYSVRLDSAFGAHINIVTTAIVLQMLRADRDMKGLRYLIIDEVHDRDAHCDTLLVLSRRLIRRNPSIKLIVMSATLQSSVFSKWFDNAPVIHVDGRLHTVREIKLEDLQAIGAPPQFAPLPRWQIQRRGIDPEALRPTNPSLVAFAIQDAIRNGYAHQRASILVFLPGWRELTKCRDAAVALLGHSKLHCVLLHSSVDKAAQQAAFARPPDSHIKVVFATNIAESGITIDDVGVVIDSGLEREMSSNLVQHGSGGTDSGRLNHLRLVYISRASATQRLGRAGRTKSGVCYRLYPSVIEKSLAEFHRPEIVRIALDSTILRLAAHGVDIDSFMAELIDSPPQLHIDFAVRQLRAIGAVRQQAAATPNPPTGKHGVLRMTPLGRWLSKIPAPPHIAKMIVYGAVFRCLDPVLCVAACSELSPFSTNKDDRKHVDHIRTELADGVASDQLVLYTAYNRAALATQPPMEAVVASLLLNYSALRTISKYKQQYRDVLREGGFVTDASDYAGQSKPARNGPLFVDGSEATDPLRRFDASFLKAIVASALYPNFGHAEVQSNGDGSRGAKKLRTIAHGVISIDPQSVVRKCPRVLADGLFAFDELVALESKAPHACKVTEVSLWTLLVLGAGPDSMHFDRATQIASLDGWFHFECPEAVFTALLRLRRCIAYRIDRQIHDPTNRENRERLRAVGDIVAELSKLSSTPVSQSLADLRIRDTAASCRASSSDRWRL